MDKIYSNKMLQAKILCKIDITDMVLPVSVRARSCNFLLNSSYLSFDVFSILIIFCLSESDDKT